LRHSSSLEAHTLTLSRLLQSSSFINYGGLIFILWNKNRESSSLLECSAIVNSQVEYRRKMAHIDTSALRKWHTLAKRQKHTFIIVIGMCILAKNNYSNSKPPKHPWTELYQYTASPTSQPPKHPNSRTKSQK
jgi:hypothetical protein